MVYRIHFTVEDLARTRVAETGMPLSELHHAARALQDHSQPVRLDAWRARTPAALTAPARMALSLIPPVGWAPGFLTPARPGTPEELLEEVRATPARRIREDLADIARWQPLPAWAYRLADDAETRRRLCDGLHTLFGQLLAPYWERLDDMFTADRAVRMRHLLQGGVELLLAQANPRWMSWNPPVLEIRMVNGIEHDLWLQGQGVLLVPSAFATRTLVDDCAEAQPLVTYPVGCDQALQRLTSFAAPAGQSGCPSFLPALLGSTRATVLTAVGEHPGCSTKELAGYAGISTPSASEHATVLRAAGLVSTSRYRNSAVHSLTALGAALLNSSDGQQD